MPARPTSDKAAAQLSELRKRAAAAGVDPDELEAARDEDQPKEASHPGLMQPASH